MIRQVGDIRHQQAEVSLFCQPIDIRPIRNQSISKNPVSQLFQKLPERQSAGHAAKVMLISAVQQTSAGAMSVTKTTPAAFTVLRAQVPLMIQSLQGYPLRLQMP